MPHLLFIISKYYVGHFHYVPQQALKSWKEPVHLEKKMENMLQYPVHCSGIQKHWQNRRFCERLQSTF